jgi:hypothetical protein
MIKNFKWLLLVSLTFVACSKNDEGNAAAEVPVTAGTADFSKYVSLGNSLTSGYSDGALFKKGQEGSYPNILSQQFAKVGGGAFKIPYTNDNIGGLLFGGNTNPAFGPRLYFNGVGPMPVSGVPTTEVFAPNTGGPYNNMGVPGAKSFHLLAPGYGSPAGLSTGASNPYFVRFASSPSKSILDDALAQNPTFFSLWIGNNDVLSFATSGGTGVNQLGNLDPATYGTNDITDPTVFANVYGSLVNSLVAKGAKGVLANIPDVTTIPFFTTITIKPVAPSSYFVDGDESSAKPVVSAGDLATINQLNSTLYGALHQILPDRFDVLSTTASNPLLISDESLEDKGALITYAAQNSGNPQLVALANYLGATFKKARQTKTGDYILLTTRGAIGATATVPPGIPASLAKYGITYPLQDKHILVPSEVTEIKTATDSYNVTIKGLADAKGLAFVDANALLNTVYKTGIQFGNFQITSAYATGGAFSLDGVHPCPRGYALIANEFMKSINAKYGSTFKPVDLALYPIQFPAVLE